MGTKWLIPCTAALLLYSPATATNYDAPSNEFSPNHNRFDGQVPPPPPSSMLTGFPPNEEDLSGHNSVERGQAAQSGFYTRRGSIGTSDLPIHYDFPAASTSEEDKTRDQQFSSARRDKITAYMSSTVGKIQVVCSSSFIGGGVALFIAKSIVPFAANLMGALGAIVFLIGSFFRTPFGELVRALGLSLILVLQRTSNVRKTYPTWPYVRAALGATKRNSRPFPPSRNLWTYEPRPGDVDFSMAYSIATLSLAMAFCGSSLPVPTFIGSVGGALAGAAGCTISSPLGSLCRTMGMRIVALLQELWNIQTDLRIIPKAAVVASQVIDKMMVFDRKHRVKDRFLSLVTRAYDQVTQSTSQMQDDQENHRSPLSTNRREDDLNI